MVGRHTVCVDNSLRHFHHAVSVELGGHHLVGLDNVEDQRRQVGLGLDAERQLTGWNEEVEAYKVLGDVGRGQRSIDLSFLFDIEFHIAEPAHCRPISYLHQSLDVLSSCLKGQLFECLNLSNLSFHTHNLFPQISQFCSHCVAIQTAHQSINLIVEYVSLSLLVDDQAGHSTLQYLSRHLTVLCPTKIPLQLIHGDIELIDPTVASCDPEDASLEHHEVLAENAYALGLEHVRPVPDHPFDLRHPSFICTIKRQKSLLSRQGYQQAQLQHYILDARVQTLYLVQLARKVPMRLVHFVLDVVDVEAALSATILNPASELLPHLILILNLVHLEGYPLVVGVQHVPQQSDFDEGLLTAPVVAHEWTLVVDGVVLEVDGVVVAEVVEDVPGDLRGYQSLAVGDPL